MLTKKDKIELAIEGVVAFVFVFGGAFATMAFWLAQVI